MTRRFAKYPAQPFLGYQPSYRQSFDIVEEEQHYYPHRAVVASRWDGAWTIICECGFTEVRASTFAAQRCLEAHRRANDDGTGVPL